MEMAEIMKQLEIFKSEYRPDFKTNQWRAQASHALAIKQKQLKELKEFRKVANQIVGKQKLEIFVKLVKENIPEKLYIRLQEQADAEMKYNTYDTAVQRYSTIAASVRANE